MQHACMQPPVDVQRTEPRGRGIRWRHCRHCAAAPQCFAHSAWSVLRHGIDVLTPSERVCHFGGDRRPPLTHVAAGGASGRTALRGGTRRCEGHRARLSVAMRWRVVSIRRLLRSGRSFLAAVGRCQKRSEQCVRACVAKPQENARLAADLRKANHAEAKAHSAQKLNQPVRHACRVWHRAAGLCAGHRAMRCWQYTRWHTVAPLHAARYPHVPCRAVPCRAGYR